MRWLRLWTDIIDDEKLALLAFEDRWHYVAILCMKRRGMLDVPEAPEMRDRKVGAKLGLGDADRDAVRRRLCEVALIDQSWQPVGWVKRQFDSDSSTSRVQAFRKRFRNVPVTPSETDTESDTEKEKEKEARESPRFEGTNPRAVAIGLDAGAWRRWIEYRRELRKPLKPASILAAQRQLAAFGSEQQAVVEQSIANGYQGLFPLRQTPKKKGEWL